ncbi:MAG: FtsQ-type POTRA domain-containing protein [Veillonellaceae bacterium]|nr:FtsQ-type POTRA domain-containing protein [Veillonellaceae bacterium]
MQKFLQKRRPQQDNQPFGHVFSALLILLVVLIVGFLFVNSTYFNVGNVVVEGNKYMPTEEVYVIAEIPEPVNILKLNTGQIRERLLKDLRVSDVDVIRKFPSTIVISIKERRPLAYVASSYGFVEVDKQGVILAAHKNLKQINVPMITGIRLDGGYVGDNVEHPQVEPVLEYLSTLEEPILNQISEVNIQAGGSIVCYTVKSSQLKLGKAERMAEKAKLTNEILNELAGNSAIIDYIDLNYASPFIKFKS